MEICLILTTIVIPIILWLICWSVHISMNKEALRPCKWGNFKKFKKCFYDYGKNKWYTDAWAGSFFAINDKDYYKYYIHADIIKFNGECMLLPPISYLCFKFWSYKEWHKWYKSN